MAFGNPYMLYNPYKLGAGLGMTAYSAGSRYGSAGPRSRKRTYRPQTLVSQQRKKRSSGGSSHSLKDQIRKMETVQHKTISDSDQSQLILQNQFYHHNVSAQVVTGTSNVTRTNETVYLEAIKINGNWNTAAANNEGTKFRLIVGYCDVQDNAGGVGYANTGLVTSDLFLTNTNVTYVTSGIVDPKRFTAIFDEQYTVNKSVSGDEETVSFRETINLKKTFNYAPGTVYGSDRNLYVIVMANNVSGTSGTTAVGTLHMAYDLLFRNSK